MEIFWKLIKFSGKILLMYIECLIGLLMCTVGLGIFYAMLSGETIWQALVACYGLLSPIFRLLLIIAIIIECISRLYGYAKSKDENIDKKIVNASTAAVSKIQDTTKKAVDWINDENQENQENV